MRRFLSSPFLQDVPMVMYVFTQHFIQDNVCSMINKYMYTVFFAEPDVNDPKKSVKINGPHWSATRFIAEYVMLAYPDCTVSSRQFKKLMTTIFPDLIPFLLDQRATRSAGLVPEAATVDFFKFGETLAFFTSIDWVAIYHISGLEAKRRGRSVRLVIYLMHFLI